LVIGPEVSVSIGSMVDFTSGTGDAVGVDHDNPPIFKSKMVSLEKAY
jgi:hypothetical protein